MEGSGRGMPRDRLSELHHSIILHILSLLPIRDVIKTTFLSKSWRNLWTTVPCLNFTDMFAQGDFFEEETVRSLVNRTLLCWKGSKLLKFNFFMDYELDLIAFVGDIDLWVRFSVDHNVEEFCIKIIYSVLEGEWKDDEDNCPYKALPCLYSCSSLKKLSLVGCNLRINGTPTWNHLKSLKLAEFCYTEDLINRIVLGAPLLEEFELEVMEREENLNIQSTSLRRLKIHKYEDLSWNEEPTRSTLRICCANLETLEISGFLFSDYQLEYVSSLRDVTFTFYKFSVNISCLRREQRLTKLRDLVSGLEQMERLTLSGWCFKVLDDKSENLFRPLPNVKFIKLSVYDIEHQELVDFLPCFPNLRTFIFEVEVIPREDCAFIDKPLEPEEGLSTSSSLPQLRIVEIHACINNPKTFRFILLLLNHFSMQKLVICAKRIKQYPLMFMFKVSRVLLNLQRSYRLQR